MAQQLTNGDAAGAVGIWIFRKNFRERIVKPEFSGRDQLTDRCSCEHLPDRSDGEAARRCVGDAVLEICPPISSLEENAITLSDQHYAGECIALDQCFEILLDRLNNCAITVQRAVRPRNRIRFRIPALQLLYDGEFVGVRPIGGNVQQGQSRIPVRADGYESTATDRLDPNYLDSAALVMEIFEQGGDLGAVLPGNTASEVPRDKTATRFGIGRIDRGNQGA